LDRVSRERAASVSRRAKETMSELVFGKDVRVRTHTIKPIWPCTDLPLFFSANVSATCVECSLKKLISARNAAARIHHIPMVESPCGQPVASPTASFLHDNFPALSRVVSALNANRIAFGYLHQVRVLDITRTLTNGLKRGDRPLTFRWIRGSRPRGKWPVRRLES
jgi:hypothetical protein